MKKLVLAASLCIGAFVLAPIASASAERAEGKCTITGSAIFSPGNLKVVPTPKLGYEFSGSVVCETLPAREVRKGTVEVHGEETLSCAGAIGETEAKGTMTLGGIKLPFGLTFISGAPGSTLLAAKFPDGGIAVGSATFLDSTIEPAEQCFVLKGAHALEFTAAAVGEL
jgi:hypothetical protein